MGGGQGFHSNVDPEELFRTIFGDRGGQNPFGSFGAGFGGGQQAQEFDFGPKEYHVNLTFQQAASGVDKVRGKPSSSGICFNDNCPSSGHVCQCNRHVLKMQWEWGRARVEARAMSQL